MSDDTKQNSNPDAEATLAQPNLGVIGMMVATFMNGERAELALYAIPDIIVVGRGTACDWKLDDASLSRRHAQFRWNGRQMTVEDLGSANGTRVQGKPARTATPVGADEPVQLGTLVISWTAQGAPSDRDDSDAEQTKLVDSGEMPPGPQLTPSRGTPHPTRRPRRPVVESAATFVPERDAATADEPTREFDAALALAPIPDKAIDATALKARLRTAWQTNRRPFYLGGTTLFIALLLAGQTLWQRYTQRDELFPVDSSDKGGKPVVIQLSQPDLAEPHAAPIAAPSPVVMPIGRPAGGEPAGAEPLVSPAPVAAPVAAAAAPSNDEERLEHAITAYEQGHLPEALQYFRTMAQQDPRDEGARYMVDLIETKMKGTP